MSKGAVVLVLDITLPRAAALVEACNLCDRILTDKMIYAPSDEVSVILAGTEKSRSALYEQSVQARYNHITVAAELGPATSLTLAPIAATRAGVAVLPEGETVRPSIAEAYDFIDALQVAVAVLQARTSQKKYNRCIYFLTDARHEVRHKEDLLSLIDILQRDQVALVVIGFDFQALPAPADSQGEFNESTTVVPSAWAALDRKAQNERILAALCTELGPPSTLVSPAEALASLSLLRCRRIRQQPVLKVALRMGDVRLATQLFTLTQEERLPSLRRSTQDGVDVAQTIEYVVLGGVEERPCALAKEERVEAFFLGVDRISCSEADREAMRVKGPRALEAIGFVGEAEVEPYLLMGGTRALLPLAGDHAGQRGFNALVDAMASSRKAMLVRLVRTADAAPSLCVCFARTAGSSAAQRHLVLAPLPFAEDVRALRFSEYPELQFSAAEEQLMDELIDGLSVDDSVLAPHDTFNPVLQQYYATLRAKLSAMNVSAEKGNTKATSPEAAVPQLLPTLRGTSTDFFAEGSEVYEVVSAHRSALVSCATAFPYEDEADALLSGSRDAGRKGKPWYQDVAMTPSLIGPQAGSPPPAAQGSDGAPSTIAPAIAGGARCGGEADEASAGSHTASDANSISTVPHDTISGGVSFAITSVDPVGSFSMIVHHPAVTEAQLNKAKDDLSDVIWELLRSSIKDAIYRKCMACIMALRQFCVTQDDAAYYNDFLLKLEVVARQCSRDADFWVPYVVERKDGANVWPITAQECKSAALPDDTAAKAFLQKDRFDPAIAFDDTADDDDWLAEIQ
ncbi:putative KU80 protein [Leishmania major strain Friedlin]|uniref:Putative KU80 protein n=1 Tax=Leishmania major TaxID=5664 RepID=Q4Q7S5_LEIMA|nr:putative KU80 protein [Leishmania major strain Friedlin]CAG9578156.1 KU80_protein_-_putative [Leishmania major strain Friedlin]CAJ05844.1 putative KU80 protein [Leishmania major strain Friedlin]|eukprot:XP_001684623.1 putative KU80 protein [Leishmania major strain Friedlin]